MHARMQSPYGKQSRIVLEGNKESKKMQNTILKQNYENFDASSQDGPDKNCDRFQKLISQLEIHGKVISQEDANTKIKLLLHRMLTVSCFSFFTNQSNAPQVDNEDLEQIDTDDLEEMDLKWQVTMLTLRVKRFIKKTGRKLDLNGKETVVFDMTKVECYNCHMRGHFARQCRAPRNQGNRNRHAPTRNTLEDTSTTNALVVQDGIGLKGEGYHVVPPPYTRNCMPPRADLSFAGLDDSVFKSKVSKTVTSVPKIETNASKTSNDNLEKPKNVRSKASLIEGWKSDIKDKDVFKPKEDQGIFDNGCSKHITRNMSYLTDYQEIDGGFVSFGGNAKGDTECVVLSLDFKLLDESQSCLRLGHINFKTMNKLVRGNLVRGYFINSKAFRVFNTRTRFVEENLHIYFLENKPNVAGTGPNWMFDIETLTMSMNYQPVFVGNQTNGNAEKGVKEQDEALRKQSEQEYERLFGQGEAANTNNTNKLNSVSLPDKSVRSSFTTMDPGRERAQRNELESMFGQGKDANANSTYRMFIPDTGNFSGAYDDEVKGVVADFNNLEHTTVFSLIPTTRIHKDHPKEQIIRDPLSAPKTKRMTKTSQEHAMVSYIKKQRRTNHKDYHNFLFACFFSQIEPKKVIQALTDPSWIEAMQDELLQFRLQKFPDKVSNVEALYGLYQALRAWYETFSTYLLENVFRREIIDKTLFIKKDKGDILLVQVYVDDIIFGSTKKSLCTEVERIDAQEVPNKFYGEAHFLLRVTVKTASTLIETNKAFLKDEEAEDVDVHLYRSMIGSLLYLTAFRIFRYLKGQPKLGLWYLKDSPFDLEDFLDSDYAGASLDRKSTTGGC
nr:hypothetical protein [Tanacetum cinerariifolium]